MYTRVITCVRRVYQQKITPALLVHMWKTCVGYFFARLTVEMQELNSGKEGEVNFHCMDEGFHSVFRICFFSFSLSVRYYDFTLVILCIVLLQ